MSALPRMTLGFTSLMKLVISEATRLHEYVEDEKLDGLFDEVKSKLTSEDQEILRVGMDMRNTASQPDSLAQLFAEAEDAQKLDADTHAKARGAKRLATSEASGSAAADEQQRAAKRQKTQQSLDPPKPRSVKQTEADAKQLEDEELQLKNKQGPKKPKQVIQMNPTVAATKLTTDTGEEMDLEQLLRFHRIPFTSAREARAQQLVNQLGQLPDHDSEEAKKLLLEVGELAAAGVRIPERVVGMSKRP